MSDREVPSPRPAARTPMLEWVAAGIGLLLAVSALYFVGREALAGDPAPPEVVLRALDIKALPSGHLVTVSIRNLGDRPAAQVLVEGQLTLPGGTTEIVETTFDYVPGHSARRGGLFFQDDPRQGSLRLVAKGFVEP